MDYKYIEEESMKPKVARVTGPARVAGEAPQGIHISKERMDSMLREHVYIDSEAVDAVLALIDRKLSEDCGYVEGVTVYSITSLRLIAIGAGSNLVKDGPFIAVFPRKFALEEEGACMDALRQKKQTKDVDVIHYSLVSNINCSSNEVYVYETLPAYRNKAALLTEEQRMLLKRLMKANDNSLNVKCVNVIPQRESECGAISIALAVKLCFSAPDEKAVFEKFERVRDNFVECLKLNDLIDFQSRKIDNRINSKDHLFNIII